GNADMQDFYNTKIAPFAGDEMAKSDLYGRLAGVANEQLKAFMYYKISQALERGVQVDLDVVLSHLKTGMEFVDLVRILGILLDNAIEECMEIPGGHMGIKISQNHEMLSIVVKNDVRQDTKEKGVRPGVSTKGEGRGKGLLTVRRIAQQYDFVALNSYFTGDTFVQSLMVYTEE
ncbi:MAG: GHKL domain-containing protein, partial [Defluviitaleaceae bacterium]|nr:GHKL domain-containing protein [Defluviitaleaceae bacterium]